VRASPWCIRTTRTLPQRPGNRRSGDRPCCALARKRPDEPSAISTGIPKNLLRKAAARSKEALVEAIGMALSAVTDEYAWGYFEHAGYRPIGQSL
jgi:hypothetical protein